MASCKDYHKDIHSPENTPSLSDSDSHRDQLSNEEDHLSIDSREPLNSDSSSSGGDLSGLIEEGDVLNCVSSNSGDSTAGDGAASVLSLPFPPDVIQLTELGPSTSRKRTCFEKKYDDYEIGSPHYGKVPHLSSVDVSAHCSLGTSNIFTFYHIL